MKPVAVTFKSVEDRDRFVDMMFPQRDGLDIPGAYAVQHPVVDVIQVFDYTVEMFSYIGEKP